MNEHKNFVGCLSRSIKNADQDIQNNVFVVLSGQLRSSRQWQGYQRAGAYKATFTKTHQMIEHQNHVGCVSRSNKKANQDTEKKFFLDLTGQLRIS